METKKLSAFICGPKWFFSILLDPSIWRRLGHWIVSQSNQASVAGGRASVVCRMTVRRALELLASYPNKAALIAGYPFLEQEDLNQAPSANELDRRFGSTRPKGLGVKQQSRAPVDKEAAAKPDQVIAALLERVANQPARPEWHKKSGPGVRASGHTNGMKTAVSIPDDVFEAAERLARGAKKSRSRLFSDALKEYVARHAPEAVTEAMNRTCAELGDSGDDFVASAGRRVLERSEW